VPEAGGEGEEEEEEGGAGEGEEEEAGGGMGGEGSSGGGGGRKKRAAAAAAAAAAAKAQQAAAAAAAAAAAPSPASLSEFLKMLCGGLGSESPKLRAATLLALSKVLHAFPTHAAISAALPGLLRSLLPLFKEKSREVVTSLVSFVKASVGFLPPAVLRPLLPGVMRGMLQWSGVRKERIKAKVSGRGVCVRAWEGQGQGRGR
jgi:hypothetical protein